MTVTYVDAVAAAQGWINSRTATLVGVGNPLQKGAHLRELDGAADTCYAYLTMLPGTTTIGGAESGSMSARIEAQIYGPSLEAVTKASVGLADEIVTYLAGQWTTVNLTSGPVQVWCGDDVTGPSDLPDGNLPRHIVDFTMVMQPALM